LLLGTNKRSACFVLDKFQNIAVLLRDKDDSHNRLLSKGSAGVQKARRSGDQEN
jgi:hypothetical protein